MTYHTLSNGLRIVHIHIPGARVDYCGLSVRVGSRNDAPGLYGLAHFVEHTIFKGTAKRSSWHIINRMEAVGGELNAYTTKEETVVYTCAPRGNLSRSVELIADLVTSSQFPENELAKEREVVADEIDSYLDTPAEAVFDEFEELLFAGTPLAHNILGYKDSLNRFTSDVCRRYIRTHYVPQRMVAFYCGSMSPSRVEAIMEKHFSQIHGEYFPPTEEIADSVPFNTYRTLGLHQAHTIMGSRIGNMYSPQRFPTALLTNILGGPGMNSLLNIELREHRGLVYTVDANASMLSDTGMMSVYFGCDPQDTDKCIALVNRCIDSLAQSAISERKLTAAKKQYLGQLTVARDNRESATLSSARATLYHGRASTPEEMADRIMSITAEEIRSAAEALLPLNRLTLM